MKLLTVFKHTQLRNSLCLRSFIPAQVQKNSCSTDDHLLIERKTNGVCLLTLNRPHAVNAFDRSLYQKIAEIGKVIFLFHTLLYGIILYPL